MEVENFSVIEEEFQKRVAKIVWCTFATVDRQGRPRSRILHPIWEGTCGWIATGRTSFKEKHLANNPFASLTYWDPDHQQIYVDCKAEWDDSEETKQRIWDLFKDTPEPLGYDLKMIWSDPLDPSLGILKLTPWRIELASLSDMMNSQVWRQSID